MYWRVVCLLPRSLLWTRRAGRRLVRRNGGWSRRLRLRLLRLLCGRAFFVVDSSDGKTWSKTDVQALVKEPIGGLSTVVVTDNTVAVTVVLQPTSPFELPKSVVLVGTRP